MDVIPNEHYLDGFVGHRLKFHVVLGHGVNERPEGAILALEVSLSMSAILIWITNYHGYDLWEAKFEFLRQATIWDCILTE
jgi:hypothetical protein